MFDKNFYPTPREVIFEMLLGEKIEGSVILEPSAGKGDILDYILENKSMYCGKDATKSRLYAIEKNYELQQIIRGKGYNLIYENFLNYEPDYIFDYIIMNPPFDRGVEHLLKAWEIAKGAKIICLLNAETYNNPYTKERKMLKNIIDNNGTVKSLGNCFSNAERKTNVEVILVKIQDTVSKSYFGFEGEKEKEEELVIDVYKDVATKDDFGNLEINYNKCKEISKKIIKLQEELKYYGGAFFNDKSDTISIFKDSINSNANRTYNVFLEKLRKKAWDNVINRTKVAELVTSKVRSDFYSMQNSQGFMAFTKENINNFFKDLFVNQNAIAQNCVEEAFDLMTKYHSENRIYFEGWKTNDRWKITQKIILPRFMSDWTPTDLSSSGRTQIEDIEKAMCFITKKSYNKILSITKSFEERNQKMQKERNYMLLEFNHWYDSEFFEYKVFKKGTIHLKFKDKWLYEEFNKIACKNKNWIGG